MELKAASPVAVTASSIRQDQELRGVREPLLPLVFPPVDKSGDSKLRRIGRGSHIDGPTIVAHVIDPVGHGSQEGHPVESHAH
jgi:hypothetical protein